MFAALQILVYDTIAGQTHAAGVLWVGAAVICVIAPLAINSVGRAVTLVALVTAVAFAVGLRLSRSVTGLMPGATDADRDLERHG